MATKDPFCFPGGFREEKALQLRCQSNQRNSITNTGMLLFPAPLCMALHKEPRLLVLHPHFGPFRTSAVVMSTVTASSEGLTSLLPLPLQSNALSRNGGFSHASCSDGCDAKAGFWASVPPATAGQRLCVCDPSEWHGARCRSPVAFTAEPQVTQATWPRGRADGSLIAPALIEKKSESSQHAGPLRVLEGLRGGMGGGVPAGTQSAWGGI